MFHSHRHTGSNGHKRQDNKPVKQPKQGYQTQTGVGDIQIICDTLGGGGAQWSFIYIFVQELIRIFKNVIFYLSSGALNSGKWQRHNIEHATMRF